MANAIHIIYCFQDSQLFVVAFQELLAVVLSMASSAVQGDLLSNMIWFYSVVCLAII